MFSDNPTIRKVIYGLAVAAQIASIFLTASFPDLAVAFNSAAALLTTLAGVTALSNISPKRRVYTLEDSENHLAD